ncbi:MAG: hypothetical protein NDI61_08705 [Bdellovibrionaceae bacterium]|nr:hypothetical protein [Pseudobdellovibrionaceae bacterium]
MDRIKALIFTILRRLRPWAAKHSRWLWAALIATTGLAAAAQKPATNQEQLPGADEADSVDTYIPSGFVLVPIEVVNYEALDSVLGRYGIVDLFAADTENARKSRLIASRIRILRAPRNPSHFAVLAPSHEAPALVRQEGGFFVVVQNPQGKGTRFESEDRPRASQPRASRIRVEMGDG